MQDIETTIQEEFDHLLFDIRRSIRYHTYRRKFFDNVNNFVTASSLILGSATVGVALSTLYAHYTVWTGAATAILSAINLVARTTEKARLHNDLVKKFSEIEKKIVLKPVVTAEDVRQWRAEVITIEMEEPPVKIILDTICHNELVYILDYDESSVVKIGPIQKAFSQFIDINPGSRKLLNS